MPNPILSLLRYNKWFGLGALLFITISLYGLFFGKPVLLLLGFFAIISVMSRIYSCKSPFDLSTIGVFSIILAIVSNIWIGAIFGISLWLLTLLWQPYFEFTYQIPNALAAFIAVLPFSYYVAWGGHNLVLVMFYYGLIRFVAEALILTPLSRPGTIVPDFVFNISELPFNLFVTALFMQLFGSYFLDIAGVTGWAGGSVFDIVKLLF